MADTEVAYDYEKTLRKDSLDTVDGDSVDTSANDVKKPSKSTVILGLIIGLVILWTIVLSSIAIHNKVRRKNKFNNVHAFDIIVEQAHYDITNPELAFEEPTYEDMSGQDPKVGKTHDHTYDELQPAARTYLTLLPTEPVQDDYTNNIYDTPKPIEDSTYDTPRPANDSVYDRPKLVDPFVNDTSKPTPAKPEAGIRGAKIVKPPRKAVKKPTLSPDNDPTVEVTGPRTHILNTEFENSPYLPVDQRCYKMTYARDIPETGFSSVFIAKAAKTPTRSNNGYTYTAMYYWIHHRDDEYYIHYAGPYDGDHLINVHEEDFSYDNSGSFTLSGMSEVQDMEKLAAEGKLGRRYLNINQKTANFRNIGDLYNMFKLRERFYKATYGDSAQSSNKTISGYSKQVLELSNCLYSL